MEVYASVSQKVNVDPISVIEKLIENEIGISHRNWIFEKEGKYYHGFESGGGTHSWDEKEEISKELYNYLNSLKVVKKYLENKNKK